MKKSIYPYGGRRNNQNTTRVERKVSGECKKVLKSANNLYFSEDATGFSLDLFGISSYINVRNSLSHTDVSMKTQTDIFASVKWMVKKRQILYEWCQRRFVLTDFYALYLKDDTMQNRIIKGGLYGKL